MFKVDIPGFGKLELAHLVTDYTGTLSVDGRLLPGVREALTEIAGFMKVHVLTSDTFGTASDELQGLDLAVHVLEGADHDVQKEAYVKKLGADKVAAFGNGRNDVLMLRASALGIAVVQGEGCATAAVISSDIIVTSAVDGLGLFTNPLRLKAALRF